MSNRFTDRNPQYPGRVKITKLAGDNDQYVIELDEGATSGTSGGRTLSAGTPLNATTLNQFEDDLKAYADGVAGSAGSAGPFYYATCNTAGSETIKVVSCPGFELKVGASLIVNMANEHTSATAAKMNVNNTGAKTIRNNDQMFVSTNTGTSWNYTDYLFMVYDGTYWVWLNGTISKADSIKFGTLMPARLPLATETTRGAVRMNVSGNTLYIYNT